MTFLLFFICYFLGFIVVFVMRDKIEDDDYMPGYIIFWLFSPVTAPASLMGFTAYIVYKKFIKRLFV